MTLFADPQQFASAPESIYNESFLVEWLSSSEIVILRQYGQGTTFATTNLEIKVFEVGADGLLSLVRSRLRVSTGFFAGGVPARLGHQLFLYHGLASFTVDLSDDALPDTGCPVTPPVDLNGGVLLYPRDDASCYASWQSVVTVGGISSYNGHFAVLTVAGGTGAFRSETTNLDWYGRASVIGSDIIALGGDFITVISDSGGVLTERGAIPYTRFLANAACYPVGNHRFMFLGNQESAVQPFDSTTMYDQVGQLLDVSTGTPTLLDPAILFSDTTDMVAVVDDGFGGTREYGGFRDWSNLSSASNGASTLWLFSSLSKALNATDFNYEGNLYALDTSGSAPEITWTSPSFPPGGPVLNDLIFTLQGGFGVPRPGPGAAVAFVRRPVTGDYADYFAYLSPGLSGAFSDVRVRFE